MADTLARFVIWYGVFIFSVTFHEFAHSLVAYWGGDSTAYEGGSMTLDPSPHMKREPWGMVVWPLLSFFFAGYMIGWASAPVDPRWMSRHPKRGALMAFAGPVANFILAGIAFGLSFLLISKGVLVLEFAGQPGQFFAPGSGYEGSGAFNALSMGLSVMLMLNIILGVFNLIPAPPLDGATVIEGLFPRSLGQFIYRIRTSPLLGLLAFIFAYQASSYLFMPLLNLALIQLSQAQFLG